MVFIVSYREPFKTSRYGTVKIIFSIGLCEIIILMNVILKVDFYLEELKVNWEIKVNHDNFCYNLTILLLYKKQRITSKKRFSEKQLKKYNC